MNEYDDSNEKPTVMSNMITLLKALLGILDIVSGSFKGPDNK